ncbi:hypothetical protein jhhlp_000133 [Lomentospora prolificans]|uniref:AAA+ ATPase domain-containing protein n=1 Tax=Lomentospora prolificans TaxID=41688 RepID=A0A2N3NLV1_9PEZI|nr:hypothetical protein jhhlp_000133 [Lomentospora prolificans]
MSALACPATVPPMAEEQPSKKLHPFFTGERVPMQPFIAPPNGAPIEAPAGQPPHDGSSEVSSDDGPKGDRPRKRRKTDTTGNGTEAENRRTRRKVTDTPEGVAVTNAVSSAPTTKLSASDQAVVPVSSIKDVPPINTPSSLSANPPTTLIKDSPTIIPASVSSTLPNAEPSVEPKSKKVIKFNPKTGTLGSPPKSKSKRDSLGPNASDASIAARKGKKKSLVVLIKYGRNNESRMRMGAQIQQILSQPPKLPQPNTAGKQALKSDPKGTPKTTHPFFSGKPKKVGNAASSPASEDNPAKPAKQVIFSSTPCSPKRARAPPSKQGLSFGIKSAGLKVPGATLPLWPAQGMTHIRALDQLPSPLITEQHNFHPRKSKGHAVGLADSESILRSILRAYDISAILTSLRQANSYDIPSPPPELRLPQKHFESGPKIQRRIRPRLKTYQAPSRPTIVESSEDELGQHVHPAISKLFKSLKSSLSAYDRSDCESSSWAQKYAPQTTGEVLQAGKEGALLREWLLNLKVQSVDTGSADASSRVKGKAGAPIKKKKRRTKLDGFIVSSGDEADELDEISDGENDWMSPRKGTAKTVIRTGDLAAKAKEARLTNAVVISGPHGCGKTAAVYAIAKELDYEVFEINASSRRSGKDVIEKVGDMTRNHLVQHQRNGLKGAESGNDTDADETTVDIKSGKQSTMASFFKPKTTATLATPATKPNPPAKDEDKQETTSKTAQPATSQKQSLILLEEVDIIYEEDKQFWVTIMTLIAQSKRPFIMTCNDENLLPLQSLSLHGIFRFHPPPTDLAVDAMLLIAANEGHILERGPVEDLYLMRSKDLRASLADLNYWCQIGVGDRRGGMDWFYPRWPKGSDLDRDGDVIRVVSEGTYSTGMGCFARDVVTSCTTDTEVEAELVNQTWESWSVDCDSFLEVKDPKAFIASAQDLDPTTARKQSLESLEAYAGLIESISAADLVAAGGFGQRFEERVDATQPHINPRSRDDFILGRTVLDAPLMTHHCPLSNHLATATKCLARAVFRESNKDKHIAQSSAVVPLNESSAISIIRVAVDGQHSRQAICRMDMSLAFDPIAVSEKFPISALGYLDPSVFDRTMKMITLDVAPFVRTIVAFDERLKKERLRLGTLLSENTGPQRTVKRQRQTRAAMSALEGGSRSTTRRERYFAADINPYLVMKTGGKGWQDAVDEVVERAAEEARLKRAEAGESEVTMSAEGEESTGSPA